jgi:Mn-dependent DtxR family transcriptional regulator
VTGHEKKEAIIRYLAHVGRANRHQIAKTIKASPEIVSNSLKELKHSGIVKNVENVKKSIILNRLEKYLIDRGSKND